MFLILAASIDDLAPILDELEAIEGFPHFDMEGLQTIDLISISPDILESMTGGKDNGQGLVISNLDATGITFFEAGPEDLAEFGVDLNALKTFLQSRQSRKVFVADTY